MNIHDWLESFVVEKITKSGKIPHFQQFQQFQQYLLTRIEKSLYGLLDRTKQESPKWNFIGSRNVPMNEIEKTVLIHKLEMINQLFCELRMNR